jgi:hypothetical protein
MEAPARDYGLAKKRLFGEKTGNRELIKKKKRREVQIYG